MSYLIQGIAIAAMLGVLQLVLRVHGNGTLFGLVTYLVGIYWGVISPFRKGMDG